MMHLSFDPRWTDDNSALPLIPTWPYQMNSVSHTAAAGKVNKMTMLMETGWGWRTDEHWGVMILFKWMATRPNIGWFCVFAPAPFLWLKTEQVSMLWELNGNFLLLLHHPLSFFLHFLPLLLHGAFFSLCHLLLPVERVGVVKGVTRAHVSGSSDV